MREDAWGAKNIMDAKDLDTDTARGYWGADIALCYSQMQHFASWNKKYLLIAVWEIWKSMWFLIPLWFLPYIDFQ